MAMDKKNKRICYYIISMLIPAVFISSGDLNAAVVIDHTSVQDFDSIPSEYISLAKSNLRIAYGHTSHGSQIVTGMSMLNSENESLYGYTTGSDGFFCDGCMSGASDLGNPDRTAWVIATRNYLNGSGNTRNVIIWSWCGQVSSATESDIADSYLANMAQLEQEFPDVAFIYMTGHLDGTGEDGNLSLRNEQIREYAREHNKILFDFADIESYDPDGIYYPDESDACGWCAEWCEGNTCPDCDGCAHSHCFNCYNKGKAFWYMTAVLAGWNQGGSSDNVEDNASGSGGGNGGGCFIATAAYGSSLEPHVEILKEFRNAYLMPTKLGKRVIKIYYEYSPGIADVISKHKSLKIAVRWGLAPVVGIAYISLHTSVPQKIAVISIITMFMTGFYLIIRTKRKAKIIHFNTDYSRQR